MRVKSIAATLAAILRLSVAADVFCGTLTVHKQKWFSKDMRTLGARESSDLRDCLNACCGIPACNAVTFMGFLADSATGPTATCILFECERGECKVVEEPVAKAGVVSVAISRRSLLTNKTEETEKEETTTIAETTIPTATQSFSRHTRPLTTPIPLQPSTTPKAETFLAELVPIWAIGVAIAIAVVCFGLVSTLVSIWLCYRRQKSRMRSAAITALKTPTLHAFSPNSLQTHHRH